MSLVQILSVQIPVVVTLAVEAAVSVAVVAAVGLALAADSVHYWLVASAVRSATWQVRTTNPRARVSDFRTAYKTIQKPWFHRSRAFFVWFARDDCVTETPRGLVSLTAQ